VSEYVLRTVKNRPFVDIAPVIQSYAGVVTRRGANYAMICHLFEHKSA